jgi:hypothetical protein
VNDVPRQRAQPVYSGFGVPGGKPVKYVLICPPSDSLPGIRSPPSCATALTQSP